MIRSLVPKVFLLLSHIGADKNDDDDLRLQKTLVVGSTLMIIPAGILWGITYTIFNEPLAASFPFIYVALSILSLGLFSLKHNYPAFRFRQLLFILLLPFFVMVALGGFANSSAVILWSLMCPLGARLVCDKREAFLWFLAYLALILIGILVEPYLRPANDLPPLVKLLFFLLNIGSVSGVAFVLLHYFIGQENLALELLRREQEKSENLLLNILPKEIAAILKNENRTIADHYAGASILFADMVNFTPMSAEMSPAAMVELLNEVFSHFDSLVEKYDLEKIKTVGDCYMVAAGVPRPRADHAKIITQLALEMRNYLESHSFNASRPVAFRFGINSGPVLAGVIGRKKFIYDLWGDAVNTASRMESHGRGGIIQITRDTYELIRDEFFCVPQGTVEVKGKGEMEVWHVIGAANLEETEPV